MRRLFTLLMLTILVAVPFLFAQQKDEEEILPPKRHTEAKMGGAGGFTPLWLFFDVDPVNQVLGNSNAAQFDKNGMLLLGGQGYGYIMLLPNVRIGGMGAGGTRKSISYYKTTATRRDVEISVGFGGVTVDYVIPVVPRLDIAGGILLGGGGMDIKMTRDNGSAKLWEDLWREYGSQDLVQDYSRKLSGSFFVIQPSVNIEYALLRWLGLRVGVSYNNMTGGEWKLDDKYEVLGVPNKINGKGWMINTGVFLGTFIY
jgi:hypothetical protein